MADSSKDSHIIPGDKCEDTEKSSPGPEVGHPVADSTQDKPSEDNKTSGYPLLRPSAFNPTQSKSSGGGILAPSKLALNPFASKAPAVHAVSSASESEEEKEKKIVAPSHFTSDAHVSASEVAVVAAESPGRSILRPSALDRQTANFHKAKSEFTPSKTSFVLKPATLQSPLTRAKVNDDKIAEKAKPMLNVEASVKVGSTLFDSTTSESEATKENYFAQLSSSKTFEAETNGTAGFVFGQNIAQRAELSDAEQVTSSSGCDTELVFGENLEAKALTSLPSVKPSEDNVVPPDDTSSADDNHPQSLEESAAAFQAKLLRPEYQEVQVSTGEEDESNVFQFNAKLFVFDKIQTTWSEKGRGHLRLNDMIGAESKKPFQSRVVMRTHGSLRVILNTKIWPGMAVERASPKGVRITAMDPDGGIKVYLIMANPKDAEQIFSAIDWRVQQQQVCEMEKSTRLGTPGLDWPQPHEIQQSREKRTRRPESPDSTDIAKKPRYESEHRRVIPEETSNDSSTVDPETEVSSESFTSSPVVKSSPSTTSE